MKKIYLSLSIFLFSIYYTHAIDVSISYATFSNASQNYVEVYLHIIASTIEYVPVDTTASQAAVEFMILFKKGDKIVKFDKFILNSPISAFPKDFIDLRRYGLENGKYQIEVTATDVNKPENTNQYNSELKLNYFSQKLQQSDIQLLSSYKKATEGDNRPMVKNGYYLEGLPFNFYDKTMSTLIFYNEIYNSDKEIGEDYMVSYSVEKVKGNDERETMMIGHKRRKPAPIDVLLLQFDIAELPSGNYNLLVEVRNRTKALLSKKSVFFQRSNPYLNMDENAMADVPIDDEFVEKLTDQELRYALKAIAPLVDKQDGELINLLVKDMDPKAMKLYLFSFWANQSSNNPYLAYLEFMKVAEKVDLYFKSGFGYGFETDRGYTYIKYGPPADIVTVEDEPSAPPYEIWVYYDFPMTSQSNVKFLFYNPSLAAGNFILLHSNARGEVNNPRWEVDLYSQSPNEMQNGDYFGGTQMQDNMGRRARRLFNDF